MESIFSVIVIIVFVFTIVSFFYFTFLFIKWLFSNKKRAIFTSTLFVVSIFSILIHDAFFKKMEIIQSEVYPNMYLIKNPIDNKDSIHKIIHEIVIQDINQDFIGKEKDFKHIYEHAGETKALSSYSINFYEYFEGWGTNPIGQAGTAHFIKNKEDPGGWGSELLEHYDEYRMAVFSINFCKDDTTHYFGNLYYNDNIDTLIHLCK